MQEGGGTLPGQHSSELSLQPNYGFFTVLRGAAAAGLLPEHPLSARLNALVEPLAAFLGALDDSENPTAQLYLQKKQPKLQTSCGGKIKTRTRQTKGQDQRETVCRSIK